VVPNVDGPPRDAERAFQGAGLLRPSFKREKRRKGESLLKPVRQLIEPVNGTLKGQLDLAQPQERHPGPAVADRIRSLITPEPPGWMRAAAPDVSAGVYKW